MIRIALVFAISLCSHLLAAQVKVDAKATGRHADAINTAKQSRQTAEEKRELAERLQNQAKARQRYSARYDSLKAMEVDTSFTKEDSLAIAATILEGSDFPPAYRDLILNPVSLESEIDATNADSLALVKATQVLEAEARKFLPGDLATPEDPLNGLTNEMKAIPSKPNPNLVKPDQARKLFKKIDPEQFQEAQADIQKLKNTYSKMPDTRYPEEGTKRNSLENAKLMERFYFGGNLSLQSTDPVIINTNLQVGYWINKKWLGGVGISLREQFANDSTTALTGDGYGYSFFTRYDIPKGFFAWGEVERQINKSFFNSENPPNTQWQSAYMLGIGREFRIGIVQMMSMVLYDFNYQNNDLNARPLVFKLGFRFSKKPG